MRISNNLAAANTGRQLQLNNNGVSKSTEKLSSGYRINRAGDDAAGLAISEKMRAQIRGLTMASKNVHDGITLIQTAEGALQETHNVLQRMRELAVQSASDTNETAIDRAALEAEFQQLKREIDDTAAKTRFNDQTLIDGTFAKGRTTSTTTTHLTQASPGTATLSASGALAQGDYTLTAGYTVKNSVSLGLAAPTVTDLGVLSDTAIHGMTLESVQFSSVNGPDDWVGYDVFEFGFTVGMSAEDMYLAGHLNQTVESDDGYGFPLSITPITLTDANNTLFFVDSDAFNSGDDLPILKLSLEKKTYNSGLELALAINTAMAAYDSKNKTSYSTKLTPVASVDADGRLVWNGPLDQPKTAIFWTSDDPPFFNYLLEEELIYSGEPLSTRFTWEEFNASKQIVFSDGTRDITLTFSGKNITDETYKSFGYDLHETALYTGLFTATNAGEAFGPPESCYEISLNGETVQVFDGDERVSVGGITLDFGGPITVPETGGAAADLDALLGDGTFSITRTTVTQGSGSGRTLVLQTGANQGDELAINIEAMNATALGILDSSIANRLAASNAITETNTALNRVSTQRAELGAIQNRLTHKEKNLDTSAENLQAAESRIRDVDMAKEMTTLTRQQILTQASQAMLAQANSQPQQVLSLLQ